MLALYVNAAYVQWLVGIDADIYFDAAESWLADGTWYLPRQLAGPYGIEYGDVLYPPILLYLLVPFRILPFALWWAIPIAATAWALGESGRRAGAGPYSSCAWPGPSRWSS